MPISFQKSHTDFHFLRVFMQHLCHILIQSRSKKNNKGRHILNFLMTACTDLYTGRSTLVGICGCMQYSKTFLFPSLIPNHNFSLCSKNSLIPFTYAKLKIVKVLFLSNSSVVQSGELRLGTKRLRAQIPVQQTKFSSVQFKKFIYALISEYMQHSSPCEQSE